MIKWLFQTGYGYSGEFAAEDIRFVHRGAPCQAPIE
jgi:hypothetical protein